MLFRSNRSARKDIALYFLLKAIERTDFSNGEEFARYYDEINAGMDLNGDGDTIPWQAEKEFWKYWEETLRKEWGITEEWSFSELHMQVVCLDDPVVNRGYYNVPYCFISWARLMYPYELLDKHRAVYEYRLHHWGAGNDPDEEDDFLEELIFLAERWKEFKDDVIDVFNFVFNLFRVKESLNNFYKVVNHKNIANFINIDMEIITQVADRLFSKENIDLFISSASKHENTKVQAFLLDYKNKHFGVDESPQQLSN